jgi:hypothetical protein
LVAVAALVAVVAVTVAALAALFVSARVRGRRGLARGVASRPSPPPGRVRAASSSREPFLLFAAPRGASSVVAGGRRVDRSVGGPRVWGPGHGAVGS